VGSLQGIGPGRVAVVEGQLVSVDEGNRTRRTLIGFGAGKSSITADAWLLYATGPTPPQTLASFQADANSGRMPGMAAPVGIGAHAGHAAESAAVSGGLQGVREGRSAAQDTDAQHLAQALAKKIAQYAASEGWIPPMSE
jgi:hypothetical protein